MVGIDLILGRELDLVRDIRIGRGIGNVPVDSQTIEPVAVEEPVALPRVEADHVAAANLVREQLALLVADVVVAELGAVG